MSSPPATTSATPPTGTGVEARVSALRERIRKAALAAGRDPGAVTLIAACKMQPAERIAAALAAGVSDFGENRVQEAVTHWGAHRAHRAPNDSAASAPMATPGPAPVLHFIGRLQTNKVGEVVALFDCIHALDRPKLAAALAREFQATGRRLPCFVQVNIGEEESKGGVSPDAADAFIAACREAHGLPVAGLMCVPPQGRDPSPYFALLRVIAERNGLTGLSMGMSADFETAVALGATHVRIGSALFGPRLARPMPR